MLPTKKHKRLNRPTHKSPFRFVLRPELRPWFKQTCFLSLAVLLGMPCDPTWIILSGFTFQSSDCFISCRLLINLKFCAFVHPSFPWTPATYNWYVRSFICVHSLISMQCLLFTRGAPHKSGYEDLFQIHLQPVDSGNSFVPMMLLVIDFYAS